MDSALILPPADQLAALCHRWKIRELRVFGSVARGEARPDSDIDLMAEYEPDAAWDLFDIVQMREELGGLFGRPVDLVRDRNVTNPYRRASIQRDLRLIYAA